VTTTHNQREREIMHWVSQGKTNWEVAQILGCVEQTVKKHLQRIYQVRREKPHGRGLGFHQNRVAGLRSWP
jgi:FixJ family two-component response regulator